MSGLLKKDNTLPSLEYVAGLLSLSTAFTTREFIESAGAPIFILALSLTLLFVPAITNITSNSYCILSNKAASGEMKFF